MQEEIFYAVIPFVPATVVALLIIIFMPFLSLCIPTLFRLY